MCYTTFHAGTEVFGSSEWEVIWLTVSEECMALTTLRKEEHGYDLKELVGRSILMCCVEHPFRLPSKARWLNPQNL